MKKLALALFVAALFLLPTMALAAEEAAGGALDAKVKYAMAIVITAGFSQAIGSAFAALGQGRAVAQALEGIARQPSASGKIQVAMIIGLAMIESLAIYVLLIALILFFVTPFKGPLGLG
jgi:F-type H+-transporting ATPase subunit c